MLSRLFDRLIDHVVDRVMARAKHNRPTGQTFTINTAAAIDPIMAGRSISYGSHAGAAAAQAFAEGVAGASPAMQHPGRTA